MTDQPQFHLHLTRPYHRSLDQQVAAIFEAAARWSAETLPLPDQAQLLLASDGILATEIQNLHDLYGQPPNHTFVVAPTHHRRLRRPQPPLRRHRRYPPLHPKTSPLIPSTMTRDPRWRTRKPVKRRVHFFMYISVVFLYQTPTPTHPYPRDQRQVPV